jgi:hypothetical protein
VGGGCNRLLKSQRKSKARGRLDQLCILRFGGMEDGDVGVGVFPERKEILI